MGKQRSVFRYTLLRIVAAIFVFEIVVGLMAYVFLMLPLTEKSR